MRRVAQALVAVAALALSAITAQAAPTGDELLARSEQGERSHDYRGVRAIRMFFPGQVVDAVTRVIHRKPATTRTEYISPPAMAGTIILQIGAQRWRHSPRNAGWQPVPAIETGSAQRLRRNYELRVTGGSVAAGRPCLVVLITPRHEGNPSKRMWVDQATGLVLRSELFNWKQDGISSSAFREIEVDPDLSAEAERLRPPVDAPGFAAADPPGFKPSYPHHLPPGYILEGTTTIDLGRYRGAHIRYGDGLNSISLFQAPARAFGASGPFASEGWHFTEVVTWSRGEMSYAVVGDIDPAQLRKIADSMGAAAPPRSR